MPLITPTLNRFPQSLAFCTTMWESRSLNWVTNWYWHMKTQRDWNNTVLFMNYMSCYIFNSPEILVGIYSLISLSHLFFSLFFSNVSMTLYALCYSRCPGRVERSTRKGYYTQFLLSRRLWSTRGKWGAPRICGTVVRTQTLWYFWTGFHPFFLFTCNADSPLGPLFSCKSSGITQSWLSGLMQGSILIKYVKFI